MKLFIILTLVSYLVTYFLVSIVPFKNIYFFNSFYLFTYFICILHIHPILFISLLYNSKILHEPVIKLIDFYQKKINYLRKNLK
jgi:hypothetical protein